MIDILCEHLLLNNAMWNPPKMRLCQSGYKGNVDAAHNLRQLTVYSTLTQQYQLAMATVMAGRSRLHVQLRRD
jgi:hypothetical protein